MKYCVYGKTYRGPDVRLYVASKDRDALPCQEKGFVDSLWLGTPLNRTRLCLPSPSGEERTQLALGNFFHDLTPLGVSLSFIPGCAWAAGRLVLSLSEVELSFQFHYNTAASDIIP